MVGCPGAEAEQLSNNLAIKQQALDLITDAHVLRLTVGWKRTRRRLFLRTPPANG